MLGHERSQDLPGGVRGAVVDEDQLVGQTRLGNDAFEHLAQMGRVFETRHDQSYRSRSLAREIRDLAAPRLLDERLEPALRNPQARPVPPRSTQQAGRPEASVAEALESHGGDRSSRRSGTIPEMPKPGLPPPQPLVTIVTPSFNQAEFIADAIESVLTQDYPAIEYIVMDGGSTDSTLDVLRSCGDRVRWTSGPDGGQSDAIHRGFLAGSGEYIAWMNSDDRYVPGAISAAVADMALDPTAGLLYGRGEFIDRGGAVMGPADHIEPWNLKRLIDTTNFLLQPATLFRREAYMAIGGLDTSLHYVMDYDLWIRLGSKYPVRYLPRVLAQARVYGETKTETGGLPRLEEMDRMIRRNGGKGVPGAFRPQMRRELKLARAEAVRQRRFGRAVQLSFRIARYATRAGLGCLRHALRWGP
jgi:glycosyltransferase involved in cell wall biosynthesis